jgi:hypothetical protein
MKAGNHHGPQNGGYNPSTPLGSLGKKHTKFLWILKFVRGSLTRKDFLPQLVTERVTQLVLLNGRINQW